MNPVKMSLGLRFLRGLARILYDFRGGQRIADAVRRGFAGTRADVLIEDFDGNLRFICSLDEHIGSNIFWRGYYSGDQLKVLGRLLSPGMHFVDIGANQGEFSLFAAKRLTAGMVSAFEPSPALFGRLEENVRLNDMTNVRAFNFALGAKAGRARLFENAERYLDGTRNDGLMTLFPSAERSTEAGETEIVRLDDAAWPEGFKRIDVMKIDVEGSEKMVLEGAAETIDGCKPAILIEVAEDTCVQAGYKPGDIVEFLASRGYILYVIGDRGMLTPLHPGSLGSFQNLLCLHPGGPVKMV